MEPRVPKRITAEQRKVMLEFLQANKELCKINGPISQRQKEKLWRELAKKINSVAGGVTKSWKQWQKSWQDWKCDTKKKLQAIKAVTQAGGSCSRTINNIEEQLLTFIGCKQVEEPKESKVPTKQENIRSDEAETLKDDSILIPIIFNEEESFPPPKKRKVSKPNCIGCASKEDELLHANLVCSERMATAMEKHSTALERMAAALEKQSDALQNQTSTLQQMCNSMELMLEKFP